MLLHTCDIGVAVGRTSGALAFPNHFARPIYGLVVDGVQRVAAMRQLLHRMPDAAGLVNAALLADGQVQECFTFAVICRLHGTQGGVDIGQITFRLWGDNTFLL